MGQSFIAEAVRDWIKAVGQRLLHRNLGSPWEKRVLAKASRAMRDELLNGELSIPA